MIHGVLLAGIIQDLGISDETFAKALGIDLPTLALYLNSPILSDEFIEQVVEVFEADPKPFRATAQPAAADKSIQ